MKLQHKSFPAVDFKVLDGDQGIFEAYVSVFNLTDRANERVMPGFFKKSLEARLPKIVFAHDWNRPIGKAIEGTEERYAGDKRLPASLDAYGGLYCLGQLNLDVQDARDTLSHLKFGSLDEFSFGYDVTLATKAKDGVRELQEGNTFEVSPVLVGCNPATRLVAVKEWQGEPLTLDALRQQADAVFAETLHRHLFDGRKSIDERMAEIDATLAEFPVAASLAFRSILIAIEGDEDAGSVAEAEYKTIFSPPARIAGRLADQLALVLDALGDITERHEKILALRQMEGRSFPSERWDHLATLKSRIETLLSARVTEESPSVDATLLSLQAEFAASRLALSRLSAR